MGTFYILSTVIKESYVMKVPCYDKVTITASHLSAPYVSCVVFTN